MPNALSLGDRDVEAVAVHLNGVNADVDEDLHTVICLDVKGVAGLRDSREGSEQGDP